MIEGLSPVVGDKIRMGRDPASFNPPFWTHFCPFLPKGLPPKFLDASTREIFTMIS